MRAGCAASAPVVWACATLMARVTPAAGSESNLLRPSNPPVAAVDADRDEGYVGLYAFFGICCAIILTVAFKAYRSHKSTMRKETLYPASGRSVVDKQSLSIEAIGETRKSEGTPGQPEPVAHDLEMAISHVPVASAEAKVEANTEASTPIDFIHSSAAAMSRARAAAREAAAAAARAEAAAAEAEAAAQEAERLKEEAMSMARTEAQNEPPLTPSGLAGGWLAAAELKAVAEDQRAELADEVNVVEAGAVEAGAAQATVAVDAASGSAPSAVDAATEAASMAPLGRTLAAFTPTALSVTPGMRKPSQHFLERKRLSFAREKRTPSRTPTAMAQRGTRGPVDEAPAAAAPAAASVPVQAAPRPAPALEPAPTQELPPSAPVTPAPPADAASTPNPGTLATERAESALRI